MQLIKDGARNLVVEDLEITGGVKILNGSNILFNDVSVSDDGLNVQNVTRFTLRDSDVTHVTDDEPSSKNKWAPHKDRESGVFAKNVDGLLIENSFFDHNGWEDGYDPNLSAKFGQAPSMYSHNVYIQGDTYDVTFRDNIVMRAAGDGAQLRAGGFVEDNTFIDNNNALLVSRGRQEDGERSGTYSLVNGNLITSGAHKKTAEGTGGLTQGLSAQGMMSSFVDNIVAHLANPDNPAEKLSKTITHHAMWSRFDTPFSDDTIIYNWVGDETNQSSKNASDARIEGLDLDRLDATTIQRFAAEFLGTSKATIADFAEAVAREFRDSDGPDISASDVLAYFRESFQIDLGPASGSTVRFVPNDLGEGMRWDNRLNWTGGALPDAGDDVDLGGNWVIYSGTTAIDTLDFGSGGRLTLTTGRLDVSGETLAGQRGADVVIDNAGQLWLDGYEDDGTLRIDADGGRFVNAGLASGRVDIAAADDAEVVLASDGGTFALASGHRLSVAGGDVKIGFDGNSETPALLMLADGSELAFAAEGGKLGQIGEISSSAFASGVETRSGISIDGADLHLDLSGLAGGKGLTQTLLWADEIIGNFGTLTVDGVSDAQDVTVIVDYQTDEVELQLGRFGEGSGSVELQTRHEETHVDDQIVSNALSNFEASMAGMDAFLF